MHHKKIRGIAVLGLAVFFALSLGLAGGLAQQKPQIHLTYSENMYATIAVVAIEKGYLAAQGLDIKHASEGTATEILEAWEPSPTRMVAKGIGRVILGPDDLAKPINSLYPFFLITPSRMIEKSPDVVQKVVNAWAQSLKYIRENPDDVARIMTESMKKMRGITLNPADVKREIYLTKYDRLVIGDADIKDTEALAQISVEGGKLKAVPDILSVIDNRFAEKAK